MSNCSQPRYAEYFLERRWGVPVKSGPSLPGDFELIAHYFAPLADGFPGAYGLRDDAAVFTPTPGQQIVVKTDAIVSGVHFLPDDPADLVARKALRVNLSDLAAKGAVPRCYLLDLILPASTTEEWVADFARGLAHDQATFGVHLIGGDTNTTPGPLTIALMALGEVGKGQILRRGDARADDVIFVTGTIGDAALGLAALRGAFPELGTAEVAILADRYRLPLPRVGIGPRLIGLASAAIDISDGLAADLGHICDVSGLDALVEASRVPLSAAARDAIGGDRSRLEAALTGGDDYEILFTAPPEAAGRIGMLSREADIPITAIGRMRPERPASRDRVVVLDEAGDPMQLAQRGWAHF
jgi:thiamine-monophosphate kinase